MWIATSLLGALLFSFATFFFKVNKVRGGDDNIFLRGLYTSGALAFTAASFFHGPFVPSVTLLCMGIIVGIGSVGGNSIFCKSIELGPVGLTAAAGNLKTIYIVAGSILFYGESLSLPQAIGVALILIALCLLPFDPSEDLSIKNARWYWMVLISGVIFTLRDGGLKVSAELHLNSTDVLLLGYFLSAVVLLSANRSSTNDQIVHSTTIYRGLLAGIFSFGGMQLYAYSLTIGPASLVFPLFASNSLLTSLLTWRILGERHSFLQVLSIFLFIAAVAVIQLSK